MTDALHGLQALETLRTPWEIVLAEVQKTALHAQPGIPVDIETIAQDIFNRLSPSMQQNGAESVIRATVIRRLQEYPQFRSPTNTVNMLMAGYDTKLFGPETRESFHKQITALVKEAQI